LRKKRTYTKRKKKGERSIVYKIAAIDKQLKYTIVEVEKFYKELLEFSKAPTNAEIKTEVYKEHLHSFMSSLKEVIHEKFKVTL
jgi:hypothetical protein